MLSVTMVDVDHDGVSEYLAFGPRDYLKLYNARGQVVWASSEKYGRTANYFLKDFGREFSPVQDPPDPKVWLPPRIVTVDLDRDGFEEIIVSHNYEPIRLLSQSRIFTKSAIFSLAWDGMDFMENWRTREMKGYVSDYQVKDVNNDGKPELLVGLIYKRGAMDYVRSKASLIAFDLEVAPKRSETREKAEAKAEAE